MFWGTSRCDVTSEIKQNYQCSVWACCSVVLDTRRIVGLATQHAWRTCNGIHAWPLIGDAVSTAWLAQRPPFSFRTNTILRKMTKIAACHLHVCWHGKKISTKTRQHALCAKNRRWRKNKNKLFRDCNREESWDRTSVFSLKIKNNLDRKKNTLISPSCKTSKTSAVNVTTLIFGLCASIHLIPWGYPEW